jgi:sucrose-phosphate synthase
MAIIPPGTDLEKFRPPEFGPTEARFGKLLSRFLKRPDRPTILTLSRADERKNITTLLEGYGESRRLQQMANLVIVAGNRDDIREMDRGAQSVLTELLLLIDYYDLYGRVAMPKHHRPDEVPEIFRITASTGGVFVNPALTEPFGLTLLEAAASGLPIVATENGGPVDIIGNCKNGILIDPLDKGAITQALLSLLQDPERWRRLSHNGIEGVRRYYSWQAHAEAYLKKIEPILEQRELLTARPVSRRQFQYHDRALFSDLDQNLLGNPTGLKKLVQVLRENRKFASFGIATGRTLNSALGVLRKFGIPMPDVLITSLGTDIRYAPELDADEVWADHIDHLWNPKAIRRLLSDLPGLETQTKGEQGRFKISYHYDPDIAPSIDEINKVLRQEEQTVNVIHAFGQYLDVVPVRASKGLALRYFAREWDIPLERILVAGGSGADEDMMRGNTLAAVVANRHHEELNQLDNQDLIYFAKQSHALGILEAIEHYDFYGACQPPQSVPDVEQLESSE